MILSTPVVFLVYNRPALTEVVFEAIARAKPRTLLVVADGPRSAEDVERCEAARAVLRKVDWNCNLLTNFAEANMGCRRRVASGLQWAFSQVEEAIILEDDCLPSQSFFPYCEQLLAYYRYSPRITSISGSNLGFDDPDRRASYRFTKFMNMWGWATWKRSIEIVDFEMTQWPVVRDSQPFRKILGNHDEWIELWKKQFDDTHSRALDTWDYPWILSNLLSGGLVVSPAINMIRNLGYGAEATHTTDPDSRLAKVCRGEMPFPLRHPRRFRVSEKYEDHLKWWWGGVQPLPATLPQRIRRKLRRLITSVLTGTRSSGGHSQVRSES